MEKLRPIDEARRTVLLTEIHRVLEKSATTLAEKLAGSAALSEITYPPNGGLRDDEIAALAEIPKSPQLVSALRKMVADAVAETFFHFFNLVDATGDPLNWSSHWGPIRFCEPLLNDNDEAAMLHDKFFETYWDWRKQRPDPGWCLDNPR